MVYIFTLKSLNKNKLNLHLAKERKINITLEINNIAGKIWEKINETKSTFLERITKINKNLATLVKGKVGKDPQITNDKIKKQDITRETMC